MLAVDTPFRQFFDLTGSPLQSGSIYFGVAGQNPETNPVTVYWDAAGTQPAAQPIRTSNGYPLRNGSPALIYASGDVSITVRDKKGRVVVSAPSSASYNNDQVLQTQLNGFSSYTDAAKGAALVGFNPTLNYAVQTIGKSLADREWNCCDYPWLAKFDGVTDDTAAITACWNALFAAGGGTLLMPGRKTKVTSLQLLYSAERTVNIRGQGLDCTIIEKITGGTAPVIRLYASVQPLVVHSTLRDFTIKGDGTRTHNGLQVESLAYLHTDCLRIQTCDVGFECLGSLIATHNLPYWVDNHIGVRLRKQGSIFSNLLNFRGGQIGSNSTLGMDLGECSGIVIRDTELNSNGTIANAATGAIRIRSTVDDETGFSRITLDNVWLENNFGRPFVTEDAGSLYLAVRSCTFTGGGADACYIGAIATFVWDSCEANSPGSSDTLTINANRCVLIGGAVYQFTDNSTWHTYLGFRDANTVYDHFSNRLFMAGNLYTTPSLVYKTLGGGPTYTNLSYTEGDHIAGFIDRENLGNTHAFLTTNGVPGNAAVCSLRVGASRVSGGTGRSINAGGTVNTLGADYAEYETKRSDCGELAKGAIVGFDSDGLLTDKWSLSKTFGIKSTAPSFVGGDTWAAGLTPDPETGRLSDADAAELEARRQRVDRIAYSGKVPANITAAVGDYVVPQEGPGDTITAAGVTTPTLEQYLAAIGQVRSIGADGRPVVALKVS